MIRTIHEWTRAILQTAVIELRHRQTRRRLTLVAAIHIGLPSYYEQINALIAAHEVDGGVVLYEGVGSLSEAEVAQLSPRERAIYRTLAPLHELYGGFAHSLGLVFQGDAVRYDRERWINADVPLRDLIRRWSDSGAPLLPLDLAGGGALTFPDAPFARGVASVMLLQTPVLLAAATRLRGWVPQLARLRELLISDRNRAALDALDATDPSRPALIFYGAGHVEDLIEGLERRGYVPAGRRWLTAFSWRYPWLGLRQTVTGLACARR